MVVDVFMALILSTSLLNIIFCSREEMIASAGVPSELLRKSQHHGLISLVSGEHQSFSFATRLAKRWITSHMLSPDISEDTTELLMAATYTCPSMLQPPASPLAGLNPGTDRDFVLAHLNDWCDVLLSTMDT